MYYPLRKAIFLHQLKQLSETSIRRIQEEKQKRQEIGDIYYHPQVDLVPDIFNHDKHGVYLTPCYKR